jgi:hypothetical protein
LQMPAKIPCNHFAQTPLYERHSHNASAGLHVGRVGNGELCGGNFSYEAPGF